MDALFELIHSYVLWAPYIIFFLLLLAGFNVPISEDLMVFISATMAAKYPEHLFSFFIAVYLGAYFSDLICYGLGRTLGPKLWNIRFFANMVSKEKVDKISGFYRRYGAGTLLIGRFIPFGVRNGLFLTAGLGKMNFKKFSLYDGIACTISVIGYFTLYYIYGKTVMEYVQKANRVIFAVAIVALVFWLWHRYRLKKNYKRQR